MDVCWIILLLFLSMGVLLMLRGMLRREFLGKRSVHTHRASNDKEQAANPPEESGKT